MIAAEALANTAIGFLASWVATWLILGYSPAGSIGVTCMFAGLSFTRAYILRRVFRRRELRLWSEE